jgi:hypothetical protein
MENHDTTATTAATDTTAAIEDTTAQTIEQANPQTVDYKAILQRVIDMDTEGLDLTPFRTTEQPRETPQELAAIARAAMAIYLIERAQHDAARREIEALQDVRARARLAIKHARAALTNYRDGYRGNAEANAALATIERLSRPAGRPAGIPTPSPSTPTTTRQVQTDTNRHKIERRTACGS